MEQEKVKLHPLTIRIWHWINALGLLLLILTGADLRYELFDFIPNKTMESYHVWIGFITMVNYAIWLIFHIFTENVNVYLLEPNPKRYLTAAWTQIQYYAYGIFIKDPNPYHPEPLNKFNPLQKVMYAVVMMFVVPAQFLTGIMLWDMKGWIEWIRAIGGLRDLVTIHVGLFIFFCLFLAMHIFLGALGKKPTTHFKEMITGYEEDVE